MSFMYILLSVLFLHVKCEINKLKLKLKYVPSETSL